MRRRAAALVSLAAVAGLIVAAVAPVAAAGPPVESAAARHARIVAHWTPERMRAAIPRDFVRDGGRFVPRAKPGGGSGAVTGASWTRGGAVKERTGKVYFEMGAGAYVCSGSVADDGGRSAFSLVLTAGHCAYDETNGAFAENWLFIPDFDQSPTFTCSQTEYGCWTADALVVHRGYATAGGFNDQATRYDFAFAVVRDGGKGGSVPADLDAAVGGSYAVSTGLAAGERAAAFGYPAAGKYKGKDLTYCAGTVITDQYNDDATWGVGCKMTGGSSGGPWFEGLNESTGNGGVLASLNSYGYSGISNMYGPKFNADTLDVFAAARTGPTADTIVD